MKKLLVVVLSLLLSVAFGALAEGRNALMGLDSPSGEMAFRCGFALGDAFYAVAEDALYVCGPGETALTACPYPDEEEYPEDRFGVERWLFADGDAMYALRLYTDASRGEFAAATISRAGVENGAVAFTDPRRVDLDELVCFDAEGSAIYLSALTCTGGRLFLKCLSDTSETLLACVDLEDLRVKVSEEVTGFLSFSPYREGTLLMLQLDFSMDELSMALGVYDPTRDGFEALCRFPFEEYPSLSGLAYDAANDAIYCACKGEIHPLDLQTGAMGDAVNSLPLAPSSDCVPCVLPEGTYAYAETGAVLRSLSRDSAAGTRLVIRDSTWTDTLEAANLRFLQKNPDVSVAISREITEDDALIEGLLNQEADVDIYVMTTYGAACDAIRNRGYMLELDDCPNAAALVESMYPALRDSMTVNGHIVTVPVTVSASCLGVNPAVLSRLGLTVDDVPDNWVGLMDFIESLARIWPEDADFALMPYCPSARYARNQLSLYLLMDYQTLFNASETPVSFNAPVLNDLLERIRRLDFEALGFEPSGGEEDVVDYDDKPALLNFRQGCAMGEWFTEYIPVLLSIDESTPHCLEMRCNVAFVNPFTRDPQAAKAFVDELAAALPQSVTYNLVPSLNEPVRGPEYAGEQARLEERLDSLRRQLEEADAVDRQAIKLDIEDAEDALADLDKDGWLISEKQLEWFRANDENICPAKVEWLFNMEEGDALDLFMQYCQDRLGLGEMLSAVDRKIQMKAMEGN